MRSFLFLMLPFVSLFIIATPGVSLYAKAQTTAHQDLPLPNHMRTSHSIFSLPPQKRLSLLTGIPYRADGVLDEKGQYVTLEDRETIHTTPGLNCSGLVIEGSRFLLRKNISLDQVAQDRLHDSAKGSPLGHDWDFGWDLIMNISEGFPRSVLLPGFTTLLPEQTSGKAPRGFDLHATATWPELLQRMRPGYMYLVSFNKDTKAKGYSMLHYHVGIILPINDKEVWLHQTTGTGQRANQRNLADPQGLAAFLKAFKNTGNVRKYLFVLEVELPIPEESRANQQ